MDLGSTRPDDSAPHPPPEAFARRYQLEVFERAKDENTIAYLETGSGKTLISVLLIRAYAYMLRKPKTQIAVFIVPKVCLVHQQADVLEIHTDLKVGRFWGAMGLDLWDLQKWREQLNNFEVFVMTPQILLDNLRHSFFKMEMIKLLIFDECHHARRKDPYACIMNEFYQEGASELPLIFGMTASPVFSRGWDYIIGSDIDIAVKDGLLTSKVKMLIDIILDYKCVDKLRCIIFVERVIAARVLSHILRKASSLSLLQWDFLAGSNAKLNDQNRSWQLMVIKKFRCGEVNVLVATSIVEEGLDIQKCNVVIRFDLPKTVCSLIQSRGRARRADSDYVLLIDRYNPKEENLVFALQQSEEMMRQEALLRKDKPLAFEIPESHPEDTYRVESTDATVNLESSIALVYYYCSQLPSDRYYTPNPEFKYEGERSSCTLIFPPNAAMSELTAVAYKKDKFFLKRKVCLEACKRLHALKALTDHLLPAKEEEEEDFISEGAKGLMDFLPFYIPDSLGGNWAASTRPVVFYSCCISLTAQESSWKFINCVLLLESPLGPDLENLETRLGLGSGIVLARVGYSGRIELDVKQVQAAKKFQEIILNILLNKSVDMIMVSKGSSWNSDRQYLLLPLVNETMVSCIHPTFIDWNSMHSILPFGGGETSTLADEYAVSTKTKSWRVLHTADGPIPIENVTNAIVSTIHSGKYYCITSILGSLNANSLFPLGRENISYSSYIDHYMKRYGVCLNYSEQPLLEAYPIPKPRNLLLRHLQASSKSGLPVGLSRKSAVEIPPELCRMRMLGVPCNMLYSFSFLPSVMHRIEGILAASQLKRAIECSCPSISVVPPTKILEALTRKNCQESISLESLETFGDSFLKYAVSRHLFLFYNQKHEGHLTKKRTNATCNYTLYQIAIKRDIPGYIRSDRFDVENWLAPGRQGMSNAGEQYHKGADEIFNTKPFADLCNGKKKEAKIGGYRWLKFKTVADVVEALIGAHLESGGENVALDFMRWLGIEVDICPTLKHGVRDFRGMNPMLFRTVNVDALSALLNYSFNHPILLIEALTHASCLDLCGAGCYQRLEFLGDAVLDYIITLHLYRSYPDLPPGLLTDLRSAAVNNDCFSKVAVKWNLQRHLRHGSGFLQSKITEFVTFMQNSTDSQNGNSFGWAETNAPKVLGDLVESIAGAIFLDSDFDTVQTVMIPLLEPIVTPETLPYHPVRELGEICDKKGVLRKFTASFNGTKTVVHGKVELQNGPIEVTAESANKKSAKKIAAQKLLEQLKFKEVLHPRHERTHNL